MIAAQARLVVWLICVLAAAAAVLGSPARSGDFVLTTTNTTHTPTLEITTHELSVLSPSGAIRFTVTFPRRSFLDDFEQTSISSDGKYAFTSIKDVRSVIPGGEARVTKPAILVTRLTGRRPRFVQTVALPTSKNCKLMTNAPIAAGRRSRGGNYDIYVGRQCYAKCKSSNNHSRVEVLKLRYNSRKRKLRAVAKPAFSLGWRRCSEGTGPIFLSLQVIRGRPYGLLFDNSQTIKLLRLDQRRVLAGGSLSDFKDCIDQSFTIVSTRSFYGICSSTGGSYDRPLFVKGKKAKASFLPPQGTTFYGVPRYSWAATGSQASLRSLFTILEDMQVEGKTYMYRTSTSKFKKRGQRDFRVPQALLRLGSYASTSTMEIRQLLVVP